ncbi:MAG: MFS transporter [Desulfobacterota bacterium]|nr:MFS transporter [Thermodesulfobacteriota bacterium]
MIESHDRLYFTSTILFVFRVLIFITLFFFPLHLKDIGFSGWEIGMLMGVDSLMALLTTLPLGISNDLVASRRLTLLSFILLAVVYLLLAGARLFAVLMVLFILLGICNSLGQLSIRSLIYKTAGEERKGQRFSIMGFAEHSGIAVGALVGGLLLMRLSYDSIFMVTGILFFMLTPLIGWLPTTMTNIFDPALYRRELFKPDVVVFAMITFLYTYHWGAEKTVYTLFLRDCLGFSQLEIGMLIFVTVMLLAIGCLVFGRLLDRKVATLSRLIVGGLCLSAAGTMLLALSTNKAQAYVFRALHEIGDGSFMVFSYVMTSNLFSRARVGGGSGFIAQVSVLGTCAGALSSGAILEHFGPRIPMIAAAVMSLMALYCFKKFRLAPDMAPADNPW